MANATFPWRPLGGILVERGLIDETQLEKALAAQRREGRTLGEILVERGWVSPFGLATALASQHGLTLSVDDGSAAANAATAGTAEPGVGWKPLGRLLVERGLLGEVQLRQALAEQQRRGLRLGDILISREWVSAEAVAATVAAQHGLALADETIVHAEQAEGPPEGVRFVVCEPSEEGWNDLHTSASFLDATDVAFDTLDERDPEALVILRVEPGSQEIVWQYLAENAVREQDTLLSLFGYPAVVWNAAPWLDEAR
jgi:hypothetical protein